jgi:hypothetical protein
MNSGDVDEISGDGSTSPDLAAGSRLERFAADARDVFDEDVLRRLSVGDRAMLALVSRSMRDVVFTSSVGDVKDVAAVRRELGRMPNFVGSVGRLAWAKELGCPWNENTCAKAAEGGHLEVLQWARANGAPWDEKTCRAAAEFGHLEVLHGRARTAARGTCGLAPMPRVGATWRWCSGRTRTALRGTSILAPMP